MKYHQKILIVFSLYVITPKFRLYQVVLHLLFYPGDMDKHILIIEIMSREIQPGSLKTSQLKHWTENLV